MEHDEPMSLAEASLPVMRTQSHTSEHASYSAKRCVEVGYLQDALAVRNFGDAKATYVLAT